MGFLSYYQTVNFQKFWDKGFVLWYHNEKAAMHEKKCCEHRKGIHNTFGTPGAIRTRDLPLRSDLETRL